MAKAAPERRPLVAANWKMHLLRRDAVAYCRALRDGLHSAAAECKPSRRARQ